MLRQSIFPRTPPGVGKTSLTNVIQFFLERDTSFDLGCAAVNCDVSDDFSTMWHKVFREMYYYRREVGLGFSGQIRQREASLSEILPEQVTPDDIRYALAQLPKSVIIIIDEIDTVRDKNATALLAHTIKNLSDHAIKSKIILVGVADSVEELITEHRSVERSLVQVRMPRMSREELFELLDKALSKVTLRINNDARNVIAQLSHGLPHYTHSLGLYSAIKAVEKDREEITLADVYEATSETIEKTANNNQTIASTFAIANRSTARHTLHAKVLLSCALAETDGLGTFAATDVKAILSELCGKRYEPSAFQRHLEDFSTDRRGNVLRKSGTTRMFRYRFVNPMLPPYVVFQGICDKSLQGEALEQFVLSRSMNTYS